MTFAHLASHPVEHSFTPPDDYQYKIVHSNKIFRCFLYLYFKIHYSIFIAAFFK